MAVPDGVLWERDPHTAAKHRVYERYFQAWFPILLQSAYGRDGVTYAEGYAGPGEYKDGSPGSPLIAIRCALRSQCPPQRDRLARFLLLEEDPLRADHLKQLLLQELGSLDSGVLRGRGLVVDSRQGSCREDLIPLLDLYQVWNKPLLLVLDTWGSGVDFTLIQRVAVSRAAEVIITMQPSQFVRFASDPNHYGDRVFGPVVWRDVRERPSHLKANYIRSQYRRVLREAGFSYVLDFELADERSNLLYLVFGTNSDKGVEKMKDAIWSVDPYQGLGYRDPRDPYQETLPIQPQPQIGPLCRLINEHLQSLPGCAATLDDLRRFVLLDTIFRPGQTSKAVQRLMTERKVRCEPPEKRLTGRSNVIATGAVPLF